MTLNSTEPTLQWTLADGGVWEVRQGSTMLEVFAHEDDPARYSWFAVDYASGHCIDSGRAVGLVAAQVACEAAAA